jgi:hypothetical protein
MRSYRPARKFPDHGLQMWFPPPTTAGDGPYHFEESARNLLPLVKSRQKAYVSIHEFTHIASKEDLRVGPERGPLFFIT